MSSGTERNILAEERHSPGPWVSFYKDKYKEWHVGVPMSKGSMKIALFPDGCPTDNPGPDSRLIAAAPELLAAVRKLVEWQAEIKHAVPLTYLDAAKAAIAKAEGRPPDPIGDKLRSLPVIGVLNIDDPHDPRNKELKL